MARQKFVIELNTDSYYNNLTDTKLFEMLIAECKKLKELKVHEVRMLRKNR